VPHLAVFAYRDCILVEYADDVRVVDDVRHVEGAIAVPDDDRTLILLCAALVLPLRDGAHGRG